MDEITTAIGTRIKHYRKLAGLTQRALAEKAGVSESAIRKYESGERYAPTIRQIVKIAGALKLPISLLLEDEEGQRHKDSTKALRQENKMDEMTAKALQEAMTAFTKAGFSKEQAFDLCAIIATAAAQKENENTKEGK